MILGMKIRDWLRSKFVKTRAGINSKFRKVWNFAARVFARAWSAVFTRWKWVTGGIVILSVAAILYARDFIAVEWAGYAKEGMSAGTRFARDFLVALAAILGITIAAWRTFVFDRQFNLAETRLLGERLTAAAELMGKENNAGKPAIASRISGIYIMESLAKKAASDFAEQVVKNLIAYIKDHAQVTAKPALAEGIEPAECRRFGEDVKAAFAVLGSILDDATIKIDNAILDFSHQDFSFLDFGQARIKMEYYRNLREANLKGAHLPGVVFHIGADLSRANLTDANLQNATLLEVVLSDAKMQKAQLSGINLSGAALRRAQLDGANLTWAQLPGANLAGARLFLEGCSDKCDLTYANLKGASFINVDMRKVSLQHAELQGATFANADLRGADLSLAKFGETDMSNTKLENNDVHLDVEMAMDRRVWHSASSWAKGKVEEISRTHRWEFENYENGYEFAGVLCNFSERYDFVPLGDRARNLRLQVRDLWQSGNLPVYVPNDWRGWIMDIIPLTGQTFQEEEMEEMLEDENE